jgi:tetratricopeptide (TPR) repeat protein
MVQNPFSVLFTFYLLAFIGFFFYSIFTFPRYLATFQWPFVWTNAFLLFMQYCIPVTVAAVAVAYSLLPNAETIRVRSVNQPFSRLVTSHLVTFITLTVVYTVLMLGLHPMAQRNMERFSSLTLQAQAFQNMADEALDAGDRETALLNYQRYLAIDKGNRAIMELVNDMQMENIAEVPEERPEAARDLESMRIKDLAEGKEPYELFEIAEGFYEQEDYFSAHYYARLAYRIDPNRRDAQRLAARAQEMIANKDLSNLEAEEKQLFERKREGYEYFANEEYFKAFHIFRELQENYPNDADVISYLRKSQERLSKETFFLDEAKEIDTLPGPTELLFINHREEGEREIVYLGKLAGVEAGTFCKDIEVMRFNPQGLLYHYYAEYGRLRDGSINLHGVDRSSAGRESRPRYLSGAIRLRAESLPNMLTLTPTLEQLPSLKAGKVASATAASIGFFSLWQVRSQIEKFGYLEAFIAEEILRRILLPFSFLVLCLLSVTIGWRFQARLYSRAHWILFVFMPLFPLVAVFLTSLYLTAQRIILSFVLLRLGFSLSLVVFLVLQGLLLMVTMIVLAGQKTE